MGVREGIATKMGIEMDRIDESKLMVVENFVSLPGDQSSLAGNSTIKVESDSSEKMIT
jgi:hypothetical protein